MMNDMNALLAFFDQRNIGEYQRENYDKFLKENKIVFDFPSIHVTGTNGKGSTANYIQNILIASGYKVGFYQSPYFYSPTEMILINNKQISEEDFIKIFNEYQTLFEKYNLSEFEIETFITLLYFKRNNVDVAVIEVGMGGEIDATNVLKNTILSVITSISLEHTMYLGKTVSEIAYSKSGIIKENSKVLVGNLDEEALGVIASVSSKLSSKLYQISDSANERIIDNKLIFDYLTYSDIKLSTNASYQIDNAKIAIEASLLLRNSFTIKDEDIYKGLETTTLPCRMETLLDNILIDGAHNVEAIDHLLESISKTKHKLIICLFAAFKDKNIDGMLSLLSRDIRKIIITTFDHKRARKEEDYFLYLFDYEFAKDFTQALDDLILNHKDELILITGSLAFASVARKYIKEKYCA